MSAERPLDELTDADLLTELRNALGVPWHDYDEAVSAVAITFACWAESDNPSSRERSTRLAATWLEVVPSRVSAPSSPDGATSPRTT